VLEHPCHKAVQGGGKHSAAVLSLQHGGHSSRTLIVLSRRRAMAAS
jgi:hypothetical protein